MESVLSVALSNAVVAALLAIIAVVASRVWRRPALTHGLWLLVLLKLLTPPLYRLPIRWPSDSRDATEAHTPPPTSASDPVEVSIVVSEREEQAPAPAVAPRVADPEPEPPAEPTVSDSPVSPIPWALLAGMAWAAGSLAWLTLTWSRVRSLQRLLRFARPASEALTAEVRDLSHRLGLPRVPGIWLVPGKVSPMLWAMGGPPRLLLPVELLDSLDAEQRSALLVHELAHLRRRDHWVRWLEVVTMALYWWHPVVWWARRELREAEEQCCDAWVVWALPGAGRAYAGALLECLEFLSDSPRPLPAGASGVGHVADLKRRLTMIMNGTTPRRLTRGGVIALLAAAAILLPWLPSWADEQDRGRTDRKEDRKVDPKEVDQAKDEVEKLRDELAAQLRKVREAEEKLRNAAQRLHRLEGKGDGQGIRIIIIRDGQPRVGLDRDPVPRTPDTPRAVEPVRPPPMARPPQSSQPPQPGGRGEDRRIQDLERKLDDVLRELGELRRQMRTPRPGEPFDPKRPGPMPTPGGSGMGGDPLRPGATPRPVPMPMPRPGTGVPPMGGRPPGGNVRDKDSGSEILPKDDYDPFS